MNKYPRVVKSNLPTECILLLNRLKNVVESDTFNSKPNLSWTEVKKVLSDVTFCYQKNNRKVNIPDVVSENTICINTSSPKGRNFAKFLRHSFAHNYVTYDIQNKTISIILPNTDGNSLKMNCKISKKTLSKIVEIYEQFYDKKKNENHN